MKNQNLMPSEIVLYQTYKKLQEKSLVQINTKCKGLIDIIFSSDPHDFGSDYFYIDFNNFLIFKNQSNKIYALSISKYTDTNPNKLIKSRINISSFPLKIILKEDEIEYLKLIPFNVNKLKNLENSISSFFKNNNDELERNPIKDMILNYELIGLDGKKQLSYKKNLLTPNTLNINLNQTPKNYLNSISDSLAIRIISYLDEFSS